MKKRKEADFTARVVYGIVAVILALWLFVSILLKSR